MEIRRRAGILGSYLTRLQQGCEAAPVPVCLPGVQGCASRALRRGGTGQQPPLRRGTAVIAPYK